MHRTTSNVIPFDFPVPNTSLRNSQYMSTPHKKKSLINAHSGFYTIATVLHHIHIYIYTRCKVTYMYIQFYKPSLYMVYWDI